MTEATKNMSSTPELLFKKATVTWAHLGETILAF